jgi:hypothetical protein
MRHEAVWAGVDSLLGPVKANSHIPCHAHAVLHATSQGHGLQTTACGLPDQVWLLPAAMWTFTEVVSQKAGAFWYVFNRSDDDGYSRLCGICTNLKVKARLPSVAMLRSVVYYSFGCLWATTL